MCRYAMVAYKSHYACFSCRKAFKRRLLRDVTGNAEFQDREARCPQCGELMANMGKDFEAPPKNKRGAWLHLQELYKVGIAFHSCGCNGPGYIPADKERLIAYLNEQLHDFHQQLAFWRRRKEPVDQRERDRDQSKNWSFISRLHGSNISFKKSIANEEAKNFWINKIQEVERKIESVK